MQDTLTVTYTDTSKVAFIDGNGNLTTITYAALLDSLDLTYADTSAILFVDRNTGRATTQGPEFSWTGSNLRIKNTQYAPQAGALCIMAPTFSESHIMHRVSNDASSQTPSYRFQRSRGTLAAPTPVQMGSIVGRISFTGYNGTDFNSASLGGGNYGIEGVAAGMWGGNVNPLYIRINSSGWSQNVHSFFFTPGGTLSMGSGSAFTDTLYTLSVLGTARISITPASTNGTDSILVKAGAGQVSAMAFGEGTYLPTDSGQANFATLTLNTANYSRVGKTVTVFGTFQMDPTSTATATLFYMSLPIATNLPLNSSGGNFSTRLGEGGAIYSDGLSSNRVLVRYVSGSTASTTASYSFSYTIQ